VVKVVLLTNGGQNGDDDVLVVEKREMEDDEDEEEKENDRKRGRNRNEPLSPYFTCTIQNDASLNIPGTRSCLQKTFRPPGLDKQRLARSTKNQITQIAKNMCSIVT
jgi:hypothetical protein